MDASKYTNFKLEFTEMKKHQQHLGENLSESIFSLVNSYTKLRNKNKDRFSNSKTIFFIIQISIIKSALLSI